MKANRSEPGDSCSLLREPQNRWLLHCWMVAAIVRALLLPSTALAARPHAAPTAAPGPAARSAGQGGALRTAVEQSLKAFFEEMAASDGGTGGLSDNDPIAVGLWRAWRTEDESLPLPIRPTVDERSWQLRDSIASIARYVRGVDAGTGEPVNRAFDILRREPPVYDEASGQLQAMMLPLSAVGPGLVLSGSMNGESGFHYVMVRRGSRWTRLSLELAARSGGFLGVAFAGPVATAWYTAQYSQESSAPLLKVGQSYRRVRSAAIEWTVRKEAGGVLVVGMTGRMRRVEWWPPRLFASMNVGPVGLGDAKPDVDLSSALDPARHWCGDSPSSAFELTEPASPCERPRDLLSIIASDPSRVYRVFSEEGVVAEVSFTSYDAGSHRFVSWWRERLPSTASSDSDPGLLRVEGVLDPDTRSILLMMTQVRAPYSSLSSSSAMATMMYHLDLLQTSGGGPSSRWPLELRLCASTMQRPGSYTLERIRVVGFTFQSIREGGPVRPRTSYVLDLAGAPDAKVVSPEP